MNEHSLDDLIIDDFSSPVKKTKSMLPMIALIIIVLVMGVFLAKMIFGDSNDIMVAENNASEIAQSDLIPQNDTGKDKSKNIAVPKAQPKPKPKPKPKPEPKTEIQKPVEKPVEKPVQKEHKAEKPKPKPKPVDLFKAKAAYYIQVGAFNRDPNPKFLQKIKDAGLEYTININGKTRRVRVGPYSSHDDAKAALGSVKSSLGIDGFVVKQTK